MKRRSVEGRAFHSAVVLFATVAVILASAARAADLTAAGKQNLDGAKKYLAQLQTNLKLANDAAGPGDATPPPGKAKLADARLQTARQSAANVVARLALLTGLIIVAAWGAVATQWQVTPVLSRSSPTAWAPWSDATPPCQSISPRQPTRHPSGPPTPTRRSPRCVA